MVPNAKGVTVKIIGVAAQKGGAGKSTIAAHLSILADRDASPALLIDCDPQGSLVLWHRLRKADTPLLAKGDIARLPEILKAAESDNVKWCIVDTAPHAQGAIATIMRHADLTIIPTRPAIFDLGAIETTIEQARSVKAHALVVLNAVPPRRGFSRPALESEARDVLRGFNATVWEGVLSHRANYGHALAGGQSVDELEPGGAAAQEIGSLWKTLLERLV